MNERALSVALTLLLVVSSLSVAGTGFAAANTGNTDDTTFHVMQNGECQEFAAMGDGSKSVEDFYDYRSNETSPEGLWSSYGTVEHQKNQTSNLFVYDGTGGYSLVVLHDEFSETGDAPHASTITFTLENMSDGEWVVRDDTYANDSQDDDWETSTSTHTIDWKWGANRTDGGAFRGFGDATITITPGFNEDADHWGEWPLSEGDHRMEEWRLLGEGGTNVTSLDMNQKLDVAKGSCPDTTSPEADLTANPDTVANDEAVTLDASGSSDDEGIDEYRWDFTNDGSVDRTTDEATVEHTYESTGEYTASVTVVDGNENTAEATATVTVGEPDDGGDGNITYLDGDEVQINGTFEKVDVHVSFYSTSGIGTSYEPAYDVSGTTVINASAEGVNGSMITLVEAYENETSTEPDFRKEHPESDYWSEAIKPHPVTVSVEEVTEAGDGTYEVTFGYDNPNEETLTMQNSTLSGNVSGDAPREVEPGNNTFTVTWTPDSDDERATWTLNRSNFQQGDASASTQQAGNVGDGGDGGDGSDTTDPDGDVTATPSEGSGETEFTFDASNSSDNQDVVEYRWDFDGDGEYDRTTEGPETTRNYSEVGTHEVTVRVADAAGNTDTASTNVTVFKIGDDEDDPPTAKLSAPEPGSLSQLLYPFKATDSTDDDEIVKYRWDFNSDGEVEWTEHEDATSSIKPYTLFDEPGTYEATVTVVDSAGQTDNATAEFTVKKVLPNATIHASSETVEVGEEVTFTAKNFNEDPSTLNHTCWKADNEEGPDGQTWTTSFEESGQKTIKLVLRDAAGHEHVIKKPITVTAADDGNKGGGDDGGDDGNDKGYNDDPNEGNKGGGLPPADSGDDEDSKDDGTVSAPLNGEDAEMGEIALLPAADADPALEVSQTAPANVEAPSVAEDGFEAVSYVTVTDAESATFTVSKDRLEEFDATADDVTLFRYEDGAWTAVETEQVGETDDGFEFEADTSDATYAVGIDRPATSVTDLSVESQRVEPGDTVTVVATVENDGRAAGTHEVQLTVGGDVVATQTVEVEAGATAEVSLTHAFDDGGVYDVTVDGETAEVVVEAVETQTTDDSGEAETSESTTDDTSTGVPGFGVSVSLVALVAAALLALRRR